MNLQTFRQLQPVDKVQLVIATGTFLARRQQAARLVHVYFLPDHATGFFVEICYDPELEAIVVLRSFTDPAPLTEYAPAIQLPPL